MDILPHKASAVTTISPSLINSSSTIAISSPIFAQKSSAASFSGSIPYDFKASLSSLTISLDSLASRGGLTRDLWALESGMWSARLVSLGALKIQKSLEDVLGSVC